MKTYFVEYYVFTIFRQWAYLYDYLLIKIHINKTETPPLFGRDGLKQRTKLMESKYDE
jgi:hypothetical protein